MVSILSNRQRMLERGIIRALNSRDQGGEKHTEHLFGGRLDFSTLAFRQSYAGNRLMMITLPDRTSLVVDRLQMRPASMRKLDKLAIWFIRGVADCGNIAGWPDEMRREYIAAMEEDDADEDDILSFCAAVPVSHRNMEPSTFRTICDRLGLDQKGMAREIGEPLLTVKAWYGGYTAIPGSTGRLLELMRDRIAA